MSSTTLRWCFFIVVTLTQTVGVKPFNLVAYVETKPAIKLCQLQYLNRDVIAALKEVSSVRKINLTFVEVPRTLDVTQFPSDKTETLQTDAIFSLTYCSSEKKIRNYATESILPVFVAQLQKCRFRSLQTVVVRAYQMVPQLWFPCFLDGLLAWVSHLYSQAQNETTVKKEHLALDVNSTMKRCSQNIKSNRQRDQDIISTYLRNKILKVVTIVRPPFVLETESHKQQKVYRGLVFDLLNELSKRFKFHYQTEEPGDGSFGAKLSNGSWNGMIGMVERKEVHIAAGSLTITRDREDAVDFTFPFYEEPTKILLPQPEEESKLWAVAKPFHWQVWLATVVALFFISAIIHFLNYQAVQLQIKPQDGSTYEFRWWYRQFWYLFGAIVQQGGYTTHLFNGTKLVIACWWLFAIVLFHTYNGALVAFLSVPKRMKTIDSLAELVEQNKVQWTFLKNSAHQDLFSKTSNNVVYRKIGEEVKTLVASSEDGLNLVLTGQYAFIKEKSYLDVKMSEDYKNTNSCRMHLAKEEFFKVGFGIALQKNSPYLRIFNMEIMKMIQTGIMEKWRQRYWPKQGICEEDGHKRRIALDDLQGIFFFFAVGVATSTIVFFIERLSHVRKP
ncbi:putative glutamate receptor [Tachypleus tridentatus]|uniref:putative glutamate receptor n=1 Tax=Tachypleus tridentatus TaxID=6853 RepID=UPI003FCFD93D